jgi:hypothetical protein
MGFDAFAARTRRRRHGATVGESLREGASSSPRKQLISLMEATSGIEPEYTVLQTVA